MRPFLRNSKVHPLAVRETKFLRGAQTYENILKKIIQKLNKLEKIKKLSKHTKTLTKI